MGMHVGPQPLEREFLEWLLLAENAEQSSHEGWSFLMV
jgi:hypothetical protein